jgi:hypothetical protein
MSLHGFSGAAGIKYGLNVRGPKKPAGALPRPALAAFAPPSDEDEDEDAAGDGRAGANAQILRQQQRQRESQKARRKRLRCANPTQPRGVRTTAHARNPRRWPQAQEVYAAALAQDATAFDYDGVYETMKAAEQARNAKPSAQLTHARAHALTHALAHAGAVGVGARARAVALHRLAAGQGEGARARGGHRL